MLSRDRSLDVLLRGYPALSHLRRPAAHRSGERGSGGHGDGGGTCESGTAAEVRLLGRTALCVGGPSGVRLFYDESLTTRRGALPSPVSSVLFGRGAVHGLDTEAHGQRKGLFLSLLDTGAAEDLAAVADRHWEAAASRWCDRGEPVELFDESVAVLGAAVCEWAGLPPERSGPARSADLAAIVDGFGSVGVRHLAARRARGRADRWAGELIGDVRSVRIDVPETAVLWRIAHWRDEGDRLLDVPVAAVELLNVLRPATAVAWFVAFAALALDDHPEWRLRLREADDADARRGFVHEVRRAYPFAPMLAARARRDFAWHGHTVPAGRRIVLDLYGTLHDEAVWPEADRFAPERFVGAAGLAAFSDAYVPHGGGNPADGHRCPGEPATLALLDGAVRHLAALRYRLEGRRPLRLRRMPPRPHAVLADVHPDHPDVHPDHPDVAPSEPGQSEGPGLGRGRR